MALILIVDDEELIRKFLKEILEIAGHQVSEAKNGNEALKSHRQNPAGLILMDLLMPEKEGIETIIELRNNYPEVKIIAMSGTGSENLKMARFLGADTALEKPFTMDIILNTIDSLLEN